MPVKKDDTETSQADRDVSGNAQEKNTSDQTDNTAPAAPVDRDDSDGRPADRLNIRQPRRDRPADAGLDRRRETPPWERDDAPKGSTSESVMTTDENGRTRVAGPTHYTHLADGRIVGGYGIGTHHTDADVNDGEPVAVTNTFG